MKTVNLAKLSSTTLLNAMQESEFCCVGAKEEKRMQAMDVHIYQKIEYVCPLLMTTLLMASCRFFVQYLM